MRVLVTNTTPTRAPACWATSCAPRGRSWSQSTPTPDRRFPATKAGFDLIVSMGGPMNVYEEAAHPWLADENALLATTARAGLPVLGVCLGAQLIAKALGAAVTKAPVEEVGWRTVRLTADGAADPFFAGLGPELNVLQWHGDTFAIPEGGWLLATGDEVAHKAFVWGKAYGLQFHVAATPAIVAAWFPRPEEQAPMLEPFAQRGPELSAQAERIFVKFVALAAGR